MRTPESVHFSNISATTDAFGLVGGSYVVIVHADAWNAGSVTLQILAGDGSTWVDVPLGQFTSDLEGLPQYGYIPPPGQYRFNVSLATGVYVSITTVLAM